MADHEVECPGIIVVHRDRSVTCTVPSCEPGDCALALTSHLVFVPCEGTLGPGCPVCALASRRVLV